MSSVGVGVTVRQLPSGQHIIIELVPGSAAANSPIEPGELILAVNRVDCTSCSTDELADHILGPEGSVLLLQTLTQDGLARSVNLERGAPISEEQLPVYRPDKSPNKSSTQKSGSGQSPLPQPDFSASASQQPSYTSQDGYASQISAGGLTQPFQTQNPGQAVQPSQPGTTFSPMQQQGYAAHQQQQQQQQQQQHQMYPPGNTTSSQVQQYAYAPQRQPQMFPTQQLHASSPAPQSQSQQQTGQQLHPSYPQQQTPHSQMQQQAGKQLLTSYPQQQTAQPQFQQQTGQQLHTGYPQQQMPQSQMQQQTGRQLHTSYPQQQTAQPQLQQQTVQQLHTGYPQQQIAQLLSEVPSQQQQLPNSVAPQQRQIPTYALWSAPSNQPQLSNPPTSSEQQFGASENAQWQQHSQFPPSAQPQQLHVSQPVQRVTSPTVAPVGTQSALPQGYSQNPLANSSNAPALTSAQQIALNQGVQQQRQQPPPNNQPSTVSNPASMLSQPDAFPTREQQQYMNSQRAALSPQQAQTPPGPPMSGLSAPLQSPAYGAPAGPGAGGSVLASRLYPGQLASVTHV